MNHELQFDLERRPTLLEYLEQLGWKMLRRGRREEVAGLCPLHRERHPSFYVNRRKDVFYCHGCGRGGDLIRFVELLEGVSFLEALERVRRFHAAATPWEQAVRFYGEQLRRSPEAAAYLARRGIRSAEIIARMRIGYAPGRCLRAHLERCGYSRQQIADSRLFNAQGRDRMYGCLTFPLEGTENLYGRALGDRGPKHRFLPGDKGGLYGWERAQAEAHIIIVEGLFDVAALWQAGFFNAVAVLGCYLNRRQLLQLRDGEPRCVEVCLDGDEPGQAAARRMVWKLRHAGIQARRVVLPPGHDPASFFATGAADTDFQPYLDRARP